MYLANVFFFYLIICVILYISFEIHLHMAYIEDTLDQ